MTENKTIDFNLEVEEVERKLGRGCGNSSTTNPRCTCIPQIVHD